MTPFSDQFSGCVEDLPSNGFSCTPQTCSLVLFESLTFILLKNALNENDQ